MERMRIERPAEGVEFSYEIIWTDSFGKLRGEIEGLDIHPGKLCIVTDDNVAPLYLQGVLDALRESPFEVHSYIIPSGEEHKHLGTVQGLYAFLIDQHFERKDLLVALGGGVVGDLTGFTAATYLRGVPFIQIPTTLLAEVDSSVGGKTGVDFSAYKNMVGAFYQPKLVYMNAAVLKTLPDDQFASGMAEVIKSALIADASFYVWLKDNLRQILDKDPAALNEMIKTCCRIKAAVVAEDPKETGLRAILNYGHTIGHAVEKKSGFTKLHGDCVSIGMAAALGISVKRGTISSDEYDDIIQLLRACALPVTARDMDAGSVLEVLRSDKKMEGGKVKFILLDRIGHAIIDRTLSDRDILEAIDSILE